jgi:hypothetical protein
MRILRRSQRGLLPGLISATAMAFWLTYGLSRGATAHNDTASYVEVADAIARGAFITSIRTPGYPLFIIFCRLLASVLRVDPLRMLVVVQVVLLSGVATYLIYDILFRLTGKRLVAASPSSLRPILICSTLPLRFLPSLSPLR